MAERNSDISPRRRTTTSQVVDELKELWAMALPITAMNCLIYVRAVVSVLFLGRLGSLELAGGALSIGFTNITGYSVLVGLASGLEPVCSQAYGSRNWDLLSVSLNNMIFILLLATIPIGALWINLEPIMLLMGQDRDITKIAAVYCIFSLPDLLANALLQPMRVYLRSQGVTKPQMWSTLLAVAFHVPLNYLLVVVLGLGVPGVAVATVVTNLMMMVLLLGYVFVSGKWEWKWKVTGNGGVGGSGMSTLLKLAVPSCVAICLEWWWYEIVTVLAGYLPNPKLTVAATGIMIQTTSLMYNVPAALAGCVSARVGNELGSGNPYKAKLAAIVALSCAFGIGLIYVAWTIIFREKWSAMFTKDNDLKYLVASVLPIIGLSELGNCPQTIGCGVLRGTSRPVVGAHINLGAFYFVGTPIAVGLAFWLGIGFAGLWLGLLSAQVVCAASILYAVLRCTDWEHAAMTASRMSAMEMVNQPSNDEEIIGFIDVDVHNDNVE